AAAYARANGYPLQSFSFVQIPHHGSRRNVGPSVLNQLLGPIQPEGTTRFTAFVSAPKDDDNHPRKIVLNAFMRRGGKVIATQGTNKIHYGGVPKRDGYVHVEPGSFLGTVEEYDWNCRRSPTSFAVPTAWRDSPRRCRRLRPSSARPSSCSQASSPTFPAALPPSSAFPASLTFWRASHGPAVRRLRNSSSPCGEAGQRRLCSDTGTA